ncbi:MAG: dTDP-4-dehydrorhamnose 3,5-epimerase [Kiritimatiellia bacterium]
MPFEFQPLALAGLQVITPKLYPDDRGTFLESYKKSDFQAAGIPDTFVQDNLSVSHIGVLRGLHFQKGQHAQAKLVQVLSGIIYDVVVDLRPDSPTYTRWMGVMLDSKKPQLLYVPVGFAHGFQVVSDSAIVLYKTSTEYRPEAEGGIVWDDRDLSITWPLANPVLSTKDASLPPFRDFRAF